CPPRDMVCRMKTFRRIGGQRYEVGRTELRPAGTPSRQSKRVACGSQRCLSMDAAEGAVVIVRARTSRFSARAEPTTGVATEYCADEKRDRVCSQALSDRKYR